MHPRKQLLMTTSRFTSWPLQHCCDGGHPDFERTGLPVTYERLLKADQEQGNWLMYSHTYNGWRFSGLNQSPPRT